MSNRARHLALALVVLAASTPLVADDLTGADDFLCTAVHATRCEAQGECVTAPPWTLNIPQFIEVNLADKKLSTTPASGENRSTPINNIERADGFIYVQGVEAGRAFSFVIAEETGKASIAVARDGLAVSIFGACTPLPVNP
jgi:hypothetical protein